MADDMLTRRLRQLAEVTDEELEAEGDTLELEQMELMDTKELEQLLDPDELSEFEDDDSDH
jgi:ribosomal protein L29